MIYREIGNELLYNSCMWEMNNNEKAGRKWYSIY